MSGRRGIGWLAVVVGAVPGFAQEPGPPREDPAVLPAQFTQPAGPTADPPAPVVRVQVRVPATVAPGKDITYKLVVSNTSAADAYRVVVRNPIPDGTQFVKADPKPDAGPPGKPLVWTIGSLPKGEKREIELVLKPGPDAKEVRNQAFVSFEHGQAVTTRIDKPKLAVRKAAPKQATAGDPIAVRVEVTNTGRVPVAGVELVEDVTKGFEFAADPESERTNNPQQRLWKLGTLRPGERKVIDYRLTAKDAGELLTTSVVRSPDAPDGERTESSTKVLTAGLDVELKGPPTVAGGERASYEVIVRNTGTLPLANVRVTATLPPDCRVTRKTNNGQLYRDRLVWVVPDREGGPLKPGEAYAVRFQLAAETTGRRTVRVAAEAGRGLEKSREVLTAFQGTASLQWTAALDPPSLTVGRQGLLTVRVKNSGGESAKNVRLRIDLPPEVRLVKATPRQQAGQTEVAFDAVSIPADGTEEFTLTYEALKPGQAYFTLKLSADALGDQPLTKEQAVVISGGR